MIKQLKFIKMIHLLNHKVLGCLGCRALGLKNHINIKCSKLWQPFPILQQLAPYLLQLPNQLIGLALEAAELRSRCLTINNSMGQVTYPAENCPSTRPKNMDQPRSQLPSPPAPAVASAMPHSWFFPESRLLRKSHRVSLQEGFLSMFFKEIFPFFLSVRGLKLRSIGYALVLFHSVFAESMFFSSIFTHIRWVCMFSWALRQSLVFWCLRVPWLLELQGVFEVLTVGQWRDQVGNYCFVFLFFLWCMVRF